MREADQPRICPNLSSVSCSSPGTSRQPPPLLWRHFKHRVWNWKIIITFFGGKIIHGCTSLKWNSGKTFQTFTIGNVADDKNEPTELSFNPKWWFYRLMRATKKGARPSSDLNGKFPKSMTSPSAACQRVSVSRHTDRRPPRRVTAKQTTTTTATDKERLDCREAFDTNKE